MKRSKCPSTFKTRREILWYIKGLKDAKSQAIEHIRSEEVRYLDAITFHMDFDKEGNVLPSTVQPKLRRSVKQRK